MKTARPHRSRRPALEATLLLVLALAAAPAAAQLVPLGPPVRVNPGDFHDNCPEIQGRGDRSFVVVWPRTIAGVGEELLGQRFDGAGAPVGGIVDLDAGTLVSRGFPIVRTTVRPGGEIVLWRAFFPNSLTARWDRYDFGGGGGPVRIFPPRYVQELFPLPNGGFVALWPTARGTFWTAALLDASGRRVGRELRVNETRANATGLLPFIEVAAAADSSFAALWLDADPANQIMLRRFAANGAPLGPEVPIAGSEARGFSLASAPDGRTAVLWVVWENSPQGGLGGTVFVRFFDPSGAPASAPLEVASLPPVGGVSLSSDAIALDRFGRAGILWSELDPAAGVDRHSLQLWGPDGPESERIDLDRAARPFCSAVTAAGRVWAVAVLARDVVDGSDQDGIFVHRFFAP